MKPHKNRLSHESVSVSCRLEIPRKLSFLWYFGTSASGRSCKLREESEYEKQLLEKVNHFKLLGVRLTSSFGVKLLIGTISLDLRVGGLNLRLQVLAVSL